MKLSNQIIASFAGVILLLLIIGFTSQYLNNKIKNRVITEKEEAVTKIQLFGEMESYLYQSLINVQYYLDEPYRASLENNLGNDTLTLEKVEENVRTPLSKFRNSFNQLTTVLSKENYSSFSSQNNRQNRFNALVQLRERVDYYRSLIGQLFSYDKDKFESGRKFFTVTIKPFFRNNILPLLEQSKNQIRTNLDRQVAALNDRLAIYSNIMMLATVAAFLLALILAYSLYHSITERLKSLTNAAHDIGQGNLDRRIGIKTNDEIGQLGTSFNKMAENLNRITFSKELVENIIESIGDGLIVTDEKAKIQKINSATIDLLSYKANELIGKPLSTILKKKDYKILLSLKEYTKLDRYETHFIKKSGRKFPVSLSKAILHKSDGHIQGMVCVFTDITERKINEKKMLNSLNEKEILLAEIHHRVKNNLAVISGLLQMQIWETESPTAEQALEDSQSRVKSIALVHEKLYQSENLSNIEFNTYVDELLAEIHNTYQHNGTDIAFETNIAPITLNINQAISCSLLLNELIVNVYKHAFTDRNEGRIQIDLCDKNGIVELNIKDNGRGFNDGFDFKSDESMGMTIINTLVQQLKGDIKVYNDNGAVYEITFEHEKIT